MKNVTFFIGSLVLLFLMGQSSRASDVIRAAEQGKTIAGPDAADPFTSYFTTVPVIRQVISTTEMGNVTVKRFTFDSKNGANIIYGIMVCPSSAGRYPGILFSHGGGGSAENQLGNLVTYGKLGYVAFAIDIPAIANAKNSVNSSGAWKTAAPGESARLDVSAGITGSTLYDAILGSLGAFNLLRSQPNVLADKIGLTGTSWGGYMTTFLSGLLGSRVKAAYSSYGCGFYDAGSFWSNMISALPENNRAAWLKYLDAGRRAGGITAPYFIEEPSNDTFFWPEAVSKTIGAIPGEKNIDVMPNLNHKVTSQAGTRRQIFLDYYLKGTGSPLSKIMIKKTVKQKDGSLEINLQALCSNGITAGKVELFTSLPGTNWQDRVWESLTAAEISKGIYRVTIPAETLAKNPNYFVSLTDSRDITTSTIVY